MKLEIALTYCQGELAPMEANYKEAFAELAFCQIEPALSQAEGQPTQAELVSCQHGWAKSQWDHWLQRRDPQPK